jgi:hypothetical protein
VSNTVACACPKECLVHRPGLPFPDDAPWFRIYVGRDTYNDLDWIRITFPKPSPEQLLRLAEVFEEVWLDGTAIALRDLAD